MGLLINATQNLPIISYETGNNIDSVYVRIGYKAYTDGVTMEISINVYLDKSKYLIDEKVLTSVRDGNFFIQIDQLTEIQSIDVALNHAVSYFTTLGYDCQIV